MKAILDEDRIIHLHPSGVEIGAIPKGVGLERLRWDGANLVDLASLTSIWVRPKSPTLFELHCVEVPGSQEVTMTYYERKRLSMTDGVISLMTEQAYTDKQQAHKDDVADNRSLKSELKDLVEDLTFAKIDTHIDNVFGALTTAQKNSLKRLYKVVLFMAKRSR